MCVTLVCPATNSATTALATIASATAASIATTSVAISVLETSFGHCYEKIRKEEKRSATRSRASVACE